jgi:tripeptidyl-peptidase-1
MKGIDNRHFHSVTSVGGTTNINPEVAVSRFFSGGGFSDYVSVIPSEVLYNCSLMKTIQFKRPLYQEKAVSKYLSTLPKGTYEGLFNP